eukprot:3277759-Pyramimonas_sp.AAC.2
MRVQMKEGPAQINVLETKLSASILDAVLGLSAQPGPSFHTASSGPLEAFWGPLGALLGPSWGPVGPFGSPLGLSMFWAS